MITTSDEPRRSRVVQIAVLGSLAVHLLAFLLAAFAGKPLVILMRPKEKNEVVTLSQAITIDHKKKPVPVPAPQPQRALPPRPQPQPQSQRAIAEMPQPQLTLPKYRPQPVELPTAAAKRKPEETTEAKSDIEREKRIAEKGDRGRSLEPQQAQSERASRTSRPRSASISSEELRAIEEQSRRTIAMAQSQNDPLSNVHEPPVSTRRATLQIKGISGLNPGEGICNVEKSWRQGIWDYYYVSYKYEYADGADEHGYVPWPIRFQWNNDPLEYGRTHRVTVPCPINPVPEYRLPPNLQLTSPLLRSFWPDRYPNG